MELQYQLTQAEFNEFVRPQVLGIYVGMIVATAFIAFIFFSIGSAAGGVAALGVGVVYLACITVKTRKKVKAIFTAPQISSPTRARIDDRGISTENVGGAGTIYWTAFDHVIRRKSIYLIKTKANISMIIPKRVVAEESAFLQLCESHGVKLKK